MKKYFIDGGGRCQGECIVDDPVNPLEYLIVDGDLSGNPSEYVYGESGFVRNPIPIIRVVHQQVTRYQARAALLQAGLLDDVDAYIAALPTETEDDSQNMTNKLIKMAWEEVLHFDRQSVMVKTIGPATGLSDTNIDDLFCFADTIQ